MTDLEILGALLQQFNLFRLAIVKHVRPAEIPRWVQASYQAYWTCRPDVDDRGVYDHTYTGDGTI